MGYNRQTAQKFGNQPKCFQVSCIYITKKVFLHVFLKCFVYIKSNCIGLYAASNDLVNAIKSTATYKQNILRIDLYQFLFGMFPATLRRYQYISSFKKFEHTLLHTFTTYITGYRRVITFPGNLVYFININDAPFCCSHIIITYLQKSG